MSLQNNNDNKNVLIAVLAFFIITFAVDYFINSNNNIENTEQQQVTKTEKKLEENKEAKKAKPLTIEEAMLKTPRASISNGNITGSINLQGGVIDNIYLNNYKETIDKDSKNVSLLIPKGSKSEYYFAIEYKDITNNETINTNNIWNPQDENNTNAAKIKTNTKNNLEIERSINLDDKYLITITDKITNKSDHPVVLSKSSNIIRSKPQVHDYAVIHEGLVINTDNKIKEIKYEKFKNNETLKNCEWFGLTDAYWLCAVINKANNTTVEYSKKSEDTYIVHSSSDYIINLDKGNTTEISYNVFVGPKDINLLNDYKDKLNIDKFDMAIDFGWFFIITKPLTQLVGILGNIFHNMGFVILLLTILLRLLTYPLMKKSFVSMAKMRKIQPRISQLQKVYTNDKLRLNQELVAIYRKENISPLSGCLPMLLQAPIFFCLYKVFFLTISMRHAPLFGWIKDLSAPDSCYLFSLFGLLDWVPPSFLQIGLWPLIMGATMFIQQKMTSTTSNVKENKTPEQKAQEKMMLFMPILFTYVCASFPVSIVVYWTISNIIGIIQQKYVNNQIAKNIK
ncbi:MAG: membrane protein insertase YidC [Alphaproteobacteria bacterium]|nr:membrane protein insertase YidC [Alphaproteobacteria bacterium]